MADIPKEDGVNSLHDTLPTFDEDHFPNIMLLAIAHTLPATINEHQKPTINMDSLVHLFAIQHPRRILVIS